MTLKFNGLDVWPMTTPWDVTIEMNDVDAEDSGRITMNAQMQRRIVAEKDKITAKFRILTQVEAQAILAAVHGEFCRVDYTSPRYGERKSVQFYAKISPMTPCPPVRLPRNRGIAAWKDLEITLVER